MIIEKKISKKIIIEIRIYLITKIEKEAEKG